MAEYGRKYRVTLDDSWAAEKDRKDEDKIWYYEIRGRTGMAYVHSKNQLAIETTSRMYKKWPVSIHHTIHRECDEGLTLLIDNATAKDALKWIKPRKKRTLSPEAKAKAVARLQKYHFKPALRNDSETTI